MTQAQSEPGGSIRIERLLPGPIDAVFDAWTNPESMRDWLSPVGHAKAEVDPRVDGRFRVVMVGSGMEIEHTGEYLEFDPPRRLSFTWRSPYTGPDPSVVTISLTPEGDATRLVLVHERLPAEQVDPHSGGWGSILDRLGALLGEKERPSRQGVPE